METSYTTYFDESGDEGFSFKNAPWKSGSTEWFVLSAVLHHRKHIPAIKAHYAEYTDRHGKQENWHFHFQKVQHDERIAFLTHMSELPWTAMSVAIHKPSLTRSTNFQKPYYLYFYTAKLLLERISWYLKSVGGRTSLIFSTRRGLNKDALDAYLERLQGHSERYRDLASHSIMWPTINLDETHLHPNKKWRGLQMADAVASGISKAIEYSQYGTTEHRYLKPIQPILFRRKGSYLSYGIKVFPELTKQMRAESRFHWVKRFE